MAFLIFIYENLRAVYFAPDDEDYGFITLEAFFGKTVLICTNTCGVLEFVEDGYSGYIVEANSEALANSIEKLWNNKRNCVEREKWLSNC